MSGSPSRAQGLYPDEWERIKRRFCDLYVKQNKTLKEVRLTLKYEENFDATEKQYKNKIKLWDLRKNVTAEEYSRMENMIQSPSSGPLSDDFRSLGIPITDKKMVRYRREKGKKAPATAKVKSRSPSVTEETSLKLDELRSSSRLAKLCRELTEKEDHLDKLLQQEQAIEHQIADLRRLIHLETANPKLSEKDVAGSQDSSSCENHASPRQTTRQQPGPQQSYVYNHASQRMEEVNNRVPSPPATAATTAPPVPASGISAMTEANANGQWQPFQQEHNHLGNPNFGERSWEHGVANIATPLPAVMGSDPNDLFQGLDHFSLSNWMSPSMGTSMPVQTCLTPGIGRLAYTGQGVSQGPTTGTRAAASTFLPSAQQPYFGELNSRSLLPS